ncbi:hypothetical protein RF11_04462 [Thelohanellus kitauei]|uniref:Uncharacterized protein n=1 Tax=Thelohanellus kitauei TaxID=669202 RepID=A0A0C2MPV6_THEKT|nr:hypothetical protein RF11_04462 [Thelohanellus kitauei]
MFRNLIIAQILPSFHSQHSNSECWSRIARNDNLDLPSSHLYSNFPWGIFLCCVAWIFGSDDLLYLGFNCQEVCCVAYGGVVFEISDILKFPQNWYSHLPNLPYAISLKNPCQKMCVNQPNPQIQRMVA